MRILVTGGTGMAGAEVIRQAIQKSEVHQITAISRRQLQINHSKVKTILHSNFLDYSSLSEVISNHEACIWCLGISQSQVDKRQYHQITYDFTVAAALEIVKTNPTMTFVFLSGAGADLTEKSSALFARIKGKTENTLMKAGLSKLFIARPAGIKPIHKNPHTALVNKLIIPFYPILEVLWPSTVISSAQLAQAMLHVALHGHHRTIIGNQELKKIAATAVND